MDDIRDYLHYDPDSGKLYWIKPKSNVNKVGDLAGNKVKSGYLALMYNGQTHYCHRIAWYLYHDEWPEKHLDHIDRDKTNNKITNLREVSHRRNCHNKEVFNGGVYFSSQKNKWHSQIRLGKIKKHLGFYSDKSIAQKAYQEALELYNV